MILIKNVNIFFLNIVKYQMFCYEGGSHVNRNFILVGYIMNEVGAQL